MQCKVCPFISTHFYIFCSLESEYDDPADVVEISFDEKGGVTQQRYTEGAKVKPSQVQQKDDYSEPIRRRKRKQPPPDYESEVILAA